MTELKPRIAYVNLKWYAAFDRIEVGHKLSAAGVEYTVDWKHDDPDWIRLAYRADKKLQHRMVRKGDAFLLELKPGGVA